MLLVPNKQKGGGSYFGLTISVSLLIKICEIGGNYMSKKTIFGKKLLALSIVLCMIQMISNFGFVVSAANTVTLNQDFSTFTTANQKDIFSQRDNIVSTAESWTPVKAQFGKKNDDTSFLFTSKSDTAVTSTGPLIQWDFSENNSVSVGQYVHLSFEFARDGGLTNGYVNIRGKNGTANADINSVFSYAETTQNDTSIVKQNGGNAKEVSQKQWHRYDLILKVESDKVTAKGYIDGGNEVNYISQKQTIDSIAYLRINFALVKENNVYPETKTYYDNVKLEILDAEPSVYKSDLAHTNADINKYIDDTKHEITSYGLTVGTLLNGLSDASGATIAVVDSSGADITANGSASVDGCYILATKDNQTVYYKVKTGAKLIADKYSVDYNSSTAFAYLYTPVSNYLNGFIIPEGYMLKLYNQNETAEITSGAVPNGAKLKLFNSSSVVEETYTVNVYQKEISVNFDSFDDTKFYYGGSTNAQDTWTYNQGKPTLPSGVNEADVAYMQTESVYGRGKVLHTYSLGKYQDTAHIFMYKNATLPDAQYYGDEFVIDYSVMLPTANDSVRNQCKIERTTGTYGYSNPIILENGQITVWGVNVSSYEIGKWQDIKVYNKVSTQQVIVYVNGEKVYSATGNSYLKDFSHFSNVRPIQHYCVDDTTEYNSYIDNFAIYGVGSLSQMENAMNVSLTSTSYAVDGTEINGYAGKTVAELMSSATVPEGAVLEAHNADGTQASGNAVKGMYLRVVSVDGISKAYYLNISDYAVSDMVYSVNGVTTDGKFADGTVTVSVDVKAYTDNVPLLLVAAQYSSDESKGLIKCKANNKTVKGEDSISVSIDIDNAADSILRLFLWESDTLVPVKNSVDLTPFDTSTDFNLIKAYPNYSQKAITFSYDDGDVNSDTKLIKLFEEKGLDSTFNLITSYFDSNDYADVKERYDGFEIGSHTNTHPNMTTNVSTPMTLDACKEEFRLASEAIKSITGSYPKGGAWPYGAPTDQSFYDDLIAYLKNDLGMVYMRPTTLNTVANSGSYTAPEDWMHWQPNCSMDNDTAKSAVENYINAATGSELQVFMGYGHPARIYDSNYTMTQEIISGICESIVNAGIWSASNIEIYNYTEAMKKAVINNEERKITNGSDITLYFFVNGTKVSVPAGQTATF